jgi:site-specific DNA-methyltransferase (cytosine-N4-specific)
MSGKFVSSLEFDFDSFKNKSYLTHNYHPYPAKYVPQIPRRLILALSKKNDNVFDPFCGSGTTLLECLLNNRNGIGNDLNPIAYLISKAKTTPLSTKDIARCMKITRIIKKEIIENFAGGNYEIPSFYHIDFWFSSHVQKELAVIIQIINAKSTGKLRDFLLVAASSIITRVSNMESDTRYASVSKNIKPMDTFLLFRNKLFQMCKRMEELSNLENNKTVIKVYNKDSRKLDFLESSSVDLIVTSPPYPNTYDYYLYHRNRMYWLGLDPFKVQINEIGSRNKHSDENRGIEDYLVPISECLHEMKRVLKKEKYLSIVVGDAIIAGNYIRMDLAYTDLANTLQFELVKKVSYSQRNYTTSFTKGYKTRNKTGHILVFKSK